MKCPRCGNEYRSQYDICHNCYLELKEQFTQEAKEEVKKYSIDNQEEWSGIYKQAINDLLIYAEDDFGKEPKETAEEIELYYFTRLYVKYKISEYCNTIRKQKQ